MKTLTLIIITIVSTVSVYAQNFKGQVLDNKTKQPIPYVNIGILNRGIGTVSDENGNFTLKLDDKYNNDSLKISMIGYKYIVLKVKDVKRKYGSSHTEFYMEEIVYNLSEVVIRPKKYKTKKVGNEMYGSPCMGFAGDTVRQSEGYEIGTLINIKERSTFIDTINFGVCVNEFDSITIRLNIYDVASNENILKSPIYVKVKKGEKIVSIDMEKYNVHVEDDFIIAFETLEIMQHKDGKKSIGKRFEFAGGFFGSDMLWRDNIYDTWKKVPIVKLGFNATITYEK